MIMEKRCWGVRRPVHLPDEGYTGCHTHARDLQVLQGHDAISHFQVNIGAACSSEQSVTTLLFLLKIHSRDATPCRPLLDVKEL